MSEFNSDFVYKETVEAEDCIFDIELTLYGYSELNTNKKIIDPNLIRNNLINIINSKLDASMFTIECGDVDYLIDSLELTDSETIDDLLYMSFYVTGQAIMRDDYESYKYDLILKEHPSSATR